jgi:hypothetical protein
MNKSVRQREFEFFKRSTNISIDGLNKRMREIDRVPDGVVNKREFYSERNINSAKFDAVEEAINLIFNILESHNLNIETCTHCKQPLPKADNES